MTRTEEEVIEEEVIQPDEDVQVLPDNNETIDRHELELSLLRETIDQFIIKFEEIKEIESPLGSIMPYAGLVDDIPLRWALCDGSNGTLDLRDKFIMGSAMDELEVVGGSADAVVVTHSHETTSTAHSHTIAEHDHAVSGHKHENSHNHFASFTGDALPTHEHTAVVTNIENAFPKAIASGQGFSNVVRTIDTSAVSAGTPSGAVNVVAWHGETDSGGDGVTNLGGTPNTDESTVDVGTTDPSGEDGAGKNLPPYMKLAYIQRI